MDFLNDVWTNIVLFFQWLADNSEKVKALTLSFAAVVGGLWVGYRLFFLERTYKRALLIDADVDCIDWHSSPLLSAVESQVVYFNKQGRKERGGSIVDAFARLFG